ncbi:MAG: glycosyltransferase family 1 protein [Candidatus Bathyarchaeia archaeon]
MRAVIVRTMPDESLSMDVYANGLVGGLRTVYPDWKVIEVAPNPLNKNKGNNSLTTGLRKYYERFWRYPHNVMRQEADIFHVVDHSYAHLVYWLKRAGKSVVVTCHDLINFFYPENLYSRARLPSVAMTLWKFSVQGMRRADHIITVSYCTARDVKQLLHIKPERITVIPDAVDSQFRPLPKEEVESFRQQHGLSRETICLLHVGTVQERKNIFTILRVLEALKIRELPVHLWKTGEDFTAEQKAFIQNRGLQGSVTYLGRVDKHVLVQVYNAADILLFPSLYEGFGMPVLEAMACGTPVITSNVSSLPEVAGDAAILVEPMDVRAMVEAIVHIWNDPDYRSYLIKKGFDRVKRFTWETVAKQVAEIYEKVRSRV